MNLVGSERLRAERIHNSLKRIHVAVLIMNEIKQCSECDGSGLAGLFQHLDGTVGWDCYSYCDECKGFGYVGAIKGMRIHDNKFLCRNCYGCGCNHCDDGFVDWIAHSMGR